MIDLVDELAAAVCNLPPANINWLRSFGIPDSEIFGEPLKVGVANIQTFPSGFYEPNEDGDLAVIIAEGWPEPPIWDVIEDLIAFKPQAPSRWWRRRGEVQVLGAHNIRPKPIFPLTLFDNPLSWLQAGGGGLCVIDWGFDAETLLFAGPLEAETPSLKSRLERRIQQAALAKFDISIREVRDVA